MILELNNFISVMKSEESGQLTELRQTESGQTVTGQKIQTESGQETKSGQETDTGHDLPENPDENETRTEHGQCRPSTFDWYAANGLHLRIENLTLRCHISCFEAILQIIGFFTSSLILILKEDCKF